jgi:hypothetical protein
VNFNDLLILASNYNKTGATYATGDFDGDGAVNFNDLLTLARNYNKTLTAPTPAPIVQAAAPVTAALLADDSTTSKPVFSTTRVEKPKPVATKPPTPPKAKHR